MIKCEVKNLKSPVFTIETSGEHVGVGVGGSIGDL